MNRTSCSAAPSLRFVRKANQVIGVGHHRSGWPYAFTSLQPLASPLGMLFDDFVEHTFCYNTPVAAYHEPWIGVFHHPHNMPDFAPKNQMLPVLFKKPVWQKCRPLLRGVISLSRYLADYLETTLQVPAFVVKHPSEIPALKWSEAAYCANDYKWLLQVGWYLRNTRAIFQVPPLQHHRKVRLWPPAHSHLWVHEYDDNVIRFWQENKQRSSWSDVANYALVDAVRYDQLLASQVVLTEVFDASANNVVIDCIVRHTPLVVNRHPAVVEYLTLEYPLYFDDIRQVPELLETERVLAAHHFLAGLDKGVFSGDTFRQSVARALETLAK
jgi:hypothetical protein